MGPVVEAPGPPVAAEDPAALGSPVLTLDQDALFSGSAFGQRVQQALQRDRAALAQENRRIEAELVEEELALTQQRETTPPEEFAELANAFDRKVQQVRETQDGKSIQLQQRLEQERQTFLAEAGPVIATLVRRRGAFVVLDRSVILLSFEGVDITEEAIAAIDAAIGSGSSEKLAPPAQLSRPDGEGE
ncbi:MAG: OmpH family outer membrane protein [Rhodobacteraceae bacterium]|nr:OmpH family outer membrane protein [Paracoccaceae bacterium]